MVADSRLRTLNAVRRLRHVETNEARRDLAAALARESVLADQDAAIVRDIAVARQIDGDFDREALAAWLMRIRVERDRLAAEMPAAIVRTAEARSVLAGRRMAENAAEEAGSAAAKALETAAARRDQTMLEDVARASRSGSAAFSRESG